MIHLNEKDLHTHLKARMQQRGVTIEEIEDTLNMGWEATDVKSGTLGKVMVFKNIDEWEGRSYQEKEVTTYYKESNEGIILLYLVCMRISMPKEHL